jgi:hypothetical protein
MRHSTEFGVFAPKAKPPRCEGFANLCVAMAGQFSNQFVGGRSVGKPSHLKINIFSRIFHFMP